jgi:hypothetical protein
MSAMVLSLRVLRDLILDVPSGCGRLSLSLSRQDGR